VPAIVEVTEVLLLDVLAPAIGEVGEVGTGGTGEALLGE
jgi:hypothetical protein